MIIIYSLGREPATASPKPRNLPSDGGYALTNMSRCKIFKEL
jgi:hypothetical protein